MRNDAADQNIVARLSESRHRLTTAAEAVSHSKIRRISLDATKLSAPTLQLFPAARSFT
jgi:hypothetical protein